MLYNTYHSTEYNPYYNLLKDIKVTHLPVWFHGQGEFKYYNNFIGEMRFNYIYNDPLELIYDRYQIVENENDERVMRVKELQRQQPQKYRYLINGLKAERYINAMNQFTAEGICHYIIKN